MKSLAISGKDGAGVASAPSFVFAPEAALFEAALRRASLNRIRDLTKMFLSATSEELEEALEGLLLD